MERNEGGRPIYVLAVNGNEIPALAVGPRYGTESDAQAALPQAQQDYEFSPLTVREIESGGSYERVSIK